MHTVLNIWQYYKIQISSFNFDENLDKMEKHYKFILENKSDVDQEWRIYPRDPITIHPGGFIKNW